MSFFSNQNKRKRDIQPVVVSLKKRKRETKWWKNQWPSLLFFFSAVHVKLLSYMSFAPRLRVCVCGYFLLLLLLFPFAYSFSAASSSQIKKKDEEKEDEEGRKKTTKCGREPFLLNTMGLWENWGPLRGNIDTQNDCVSVRCVCVVHIYRVYCKYVVVFFLNIFFWVVLTWVLKGWNYFLIFGSWNKKKGSEFWNMSSFLKTLKCEG
jgi:hypothetical protein